MEFNLLLTILALSLGTGNGIQTYYMDQNCGETKDITWAGAIKLELTSSVAYSPNLDCSLTITTSGLSYDRLMLHFENINIADSSPCYQEFLEVKDGSSQSSPYVGGIDGPRCGSYITSSVFETSGNNLFLRFKSSNAKHWSDGFTMIIVQYHTGPCYSDEYSCENGRCIDKSVTCNRYNACGDNSDCPFVLVAGAIVGIVIGSFVFVFIIIVIIFVFLRRRRSMPYYRHVNVMASPGYGTSGYNQPQQYPSYPTGRQYPSNST